MQALCGNRKIILIGEKSAIRKYKLRLPSELSRRYGSGPYTEAQVKSAVADLRLSSRHIQYAYLMYCQEEVLEQYGLVGEKVQSMLSSIAAVGTSGFAASIVDPIFSPSDGDGGGGFDGGGGGE